MTNKANVFVNFPERGLHEFSFEIDLCWTIKDLCDNLICCQLLPPGASESIFFKRHGFAVSNNCQLKGNESYNVQFRLKGGKGGFGSMLRAIGSQIEKTTNNEACRDLSGRRMRDVNNEKKMMEWVKNKAEKDRQKEREKIEKLERQLQKPKHFFNDPEYEKKLDETIDSVEDALKAGMKASKRGSNGTSKPEPAAKKNKLWLGVDDLSDTSDTDSETDTKVPVVGSSKETDGQCSSKLCVSSSNQELNDDATSNVSTSNADVVASNSTEDTQTKMGATQTNPTC